MSGCVNKKCPAKHYKNVECAPNCGQFKAHKPEPNESPSSPRTRGSLAASPGQNEVEGTVLNSPPFSSRAESLLSQTIGVCPICKSSNEKETAWCDHKKIVGP